jgi:hypothetical protein
MKVDAVLVLASYAAVFCAGYSVRALISWRRRRRWTT